MNLDEALAWIDAHEAEAGDPDQSARDLDYETLRASLPPHVEPAFDGMSFAG